MKLNLYDKDMKRIAIIGEQFISCLWNECYNSVGNFSLELLATSEYKTKVRTDCYVGRDDRRTLMVIKTVEIKNGRIVASGKQAARVLDDIAFVGEVEAGAVITSTLAEIYNTIAKYKNITVESSELEQTYEEQIGDKTFLKLMETMCRSADIGFRVIRKKESAALEFYRPQENPNLVFSHQFGNLGDVKITLSTENLRNYAIVLGAGNGSSRIRVDVDATNGDVRRELIVDARDIQKESGETDAVYKSRLRARGVEKLIEHNEILKCGFSPKEFDFGVRYDLGDILTVYLPDYGMKLQARVAAFTQKTQNNKTETTIEVGTITIMR